LKLAEVPWVSILRPDLHYSGIVNDVNKTLTEYEDRLRLTRFKWYTEYGIIKTQ